MTFLPVVARELRVASRRSSTYWGRVVAGGMALLLSSWLALVGNALGGARNGEALFYTISVPAFTFAFLAGLLYAADSISSEKRDGTLGLLFLTDLRGHDVTLGKLAGTSLGAIYGLGAMLPFLALTLLLGGVTGMDYARMILVLMATLFASLSTGLVASVLNVDSRRAVLLAFMLMLIVMLGAPFTFWTVSWTLQRLDASPQIQQAWDTGWYPYLSPAVGFAFAGSNTYKTGANRYWISIGFTVGVAILGLATASWRLPYAWQEAEAKTARRRFAGWLNRLRTPNEASKLRFRRSILELNPVTWLTARYWIRRWLPWPFLIATGVTAAWMAAWEGGDWWDAETSFALSVFLHAIFKLWMANEAPRQFLEDRRTGAMELLLSTPLTTPDILAGQWRALHRQFLGPVVLILLVDFYGMITSGMMYRDAGPPILSILWLLRIILLVLDLWTLGWAGFWAAMTGHGRATTTSLIFRILVVPWLIWFMLATIFGVSLSRNSGEDSLLWLMVGSWFTVAALSDLFWIQRSRAGLEGTFREAATQRPGEKRGWFRRATSAPKA